jgi:hypothetical protein
LEVREQELQKELVCWKHFGAPELELQKSIWYVGSALLKVSEPELQKEHRPIGSALLTP